MATGWMQAKVAKMKRDGMRDSRGAYERFKDEPCKHTPHIKPPPGFWLDLGKAMNVPRGLPRMFGPFDSEAAAVAVAKRSKIEGYRVVDRTAKPVQVDTLTDREVSDLAALHQAKLQAQRELSRATREALGRKTAWSR